MRVQRLRERFDSAFPEARYTKLLYVRAPGRSEIAGNHTDHEGGQVIAAAVDRYVEGLFLPNLSGRARMCSEGYDPLDLDLSLEGPLEGERSSSAGLLRGVCAAFRQRGYALDPQSGFDCVLSSEIPAGSGLSSSAAFELALACGLNALWAGGSLRPLELALMSQQAEREYFGKPCGLMDQAAVALGGLSHMDFHAEPRVSGIDFDFLDHGFELAIVCVGADHSANTADYAAVPHEMQAVARSLGAQRLSDVTEEELLRVLPALRVSLGDRPVLRALHYFREERLVEGRVSALRQGQLPRFLALTRLSGASSAMYLQNVSCGVREQPAMLALALADELLAGEGASRIHGGGFGGTIQAFVPQDALGGFREGMESVFGPGSCVVCHIDHRGASAEWLEM